MKHVISIAIVAFWLLMMTWLVRTQVVPPRLIPAEGETLGTEQLIQDWIDVEEWMEARSRGRSMGIVKVALFPHHRIQPTKADPRPPVIALLFSFYFPVPHPAIPHP